VADRDFFYVFIRNAPDFAVARTKPDPELDRRLRAGGECAEWRTLPFELEQGVVIDYLPNSRALRLCSQRLRDVLERERGDADVIQWLSATVTNGAGGTLPYWILHFPTVPEVINKARSIFSGPVLVKAVLDLTLVAEHRVFSRPHDTVSLIVADKVRRAIANAGCAGMEFSRVPIA